MNYYPFHIGDYAVHTRHLTPMEDLAYRRLLDLYYTREGSLPPDTKVVARLLGLTDYHTEVESVLCEFFLQNEDGWTHTRCDAELAKMHAKQENARASVAKRTGVTQAPRERDASAIEASSTNTNTNTNKETRTSPSAPGFEEFWSAYPRRVGKDAALKAFAKRKPDEGLLDRMLCAIKAQNASEAWRKDAGQFIPHPSTWLNEGRWQDEAIAQPQAPPRTYYTPPPPPTPEERARADAARKLAVSSIRNITRAA